MAMRPGSLTRVIDDCPADRYANAPDGHHKETNRGQESEGQRTREISRTANVVPRLLHQPFTHRSLRRPPAQLTHYASPGRGHPFRIGLQPRRTSAKPCLLACPPF